MVKILSHCPMPGSERETVKGLVGDLCLGHADLGQRVGLLPLLPGLRHRLVLHVVLRALARLQQGLALV